jgi:hypothetical protein
VDLLTKHYKKGRRFQVGEAVERGPAVVLGLTISQPDWSGKVEVFKVFTFAPTGDRVVGMQDCDSRESALAMLAAG